MHPSQDPRLGFFINLVLWSGRIHIWMRLKLEEQIQDVRQEKDNTGPSAYFQYSCVSVLKRGERRMEGLYGVRQ